ncbi:MAG: DUF4157 domain-containing protein, partial [Anaerolineales bacterium]|nr:DUF4157 domain-containing protein [Anaerolineales bacterium]
LEQSIQSARGSGQPLADNVRTPMENAFGTDFSGVKVHTGSQSDMLNQSIQARAFTTGQDIFFRQGEYNLGSSGGQELLAHELTHVVQQGGATVQRQNEEDTLQTKPISKQSAPVSQISRLVEYNHDIVGGRFTDAEQARGILPFTEEGWDGRQIGQQLSQLNDAVTNNDNVRCVQAAFLVSLIQQGPGALSTMINNYLNRYRVGLAQAGTPPRIKRWYRRSVRNLQPLLAKIDAKTLTYEDLSTILTEMYDIYGSGSGGTSSAAQMSMAVREGYQGTRLNKENATQEEAAAEAQALQPGEFLLCAVEVSKEGTDQANHAIHIGRYPDLGTLYLYDPWPVKGDQMIDCDESLNNAEHYFTNPLEDETTDLDSEDGLDIEIHEMRTFHILIKFTPPAEEGAE